LSFAEHSHVDEFEDLTVVQNGADTIISDGTNELILASIQSNEIDENDFLFG